MNKHDKLYSLAYSKKYDLYLWDQLVDYILSFEKDVVKSRSSFDQIIQLFPSIDRYWLKYLEYEQKMGATERMESLFTQCLMVVPSISLWSFYISYIKQAHSPPQVLHDKVNEGKTVIIQAFEFALQNVGMDKESGGLWADYIQFIRSGETTNTYEEQQKMDSIRKLYQRAVVTPLQNIEQLWKDYDLFENNLNKLTAKKLITDSSGGYMTARAALREMKGLLEPIEIIMRSWVPKPPVWTDREVKLISAWKRWILWEKSNPLQLQDTQLLSGRVSYAYKSSLTMLPLYPEMWYEMASYLNEVGKVQDSMTLLKRGIDMNPTSLLLHFTLTEWMEISKSEYNEICLIFDSLLSTLDLKHEAILEDYKKQRELLLSALYIPTNKGNNADEWDGEQRELEREAIKAREKEVDLKLNSKKEIEINKIRHSVTLTWILYMRMSRRMQNIKSARSIFSKARKSLLCTYHIYVASAFMEFYCSKESTVAAKVFEVGMRTLDLQENLEAAEYVEIYLDFLITMNDDNNTRALFERAITGIPPSRARKIWDKWIDYEFQYGDLGNTNRVLKRMKESFPEDVSTLLATENLSKLYGFYSIQSVGELDLGLEHTSKVQRKMAPIVQTAKLDDKVRRLVSLEAFHPDRFPRPDFSKYTQYKPEPVEGEVLSTGIQETPNVVGLDLPDGILQFLKLLPSPSQYKGPILPFEDVFLLLTQLPIPVPMPNVAPLPLANMNLNMNMQNTRSMVQLEDVPPRVTDPRVTVSDPRSDPRVDPRLANKRKMEDALENGSIKKQG